MQWFKENSKSILASILVLVLYLAAYVAMPKDVFWSPDEGIKFLMTRMIYWDNGLKFEMQYQGTAMDTAFRFYPSIDPFPDSNSIYPFPQADGSIHLPWPIWFPLLASPFFHTLGISGIYLLPLVSGWLTAILAGRWMLRFDPSLAPWAILLVGLGTPVFFYSLTFWEQTLVTMAAMIVLLIVASRPADPLVLLIIAPLLIAMVILRLEMVTFGIALVLAWGISGFFRKPFSGQREYEKRRYPISRRLFYAAFLLISAFLMFKLPNLIIPKRQADFSSYVQTWVDYSTRLFSPSLLFSNYFLNIPHVVINFSGPYGPPIDELWGWVGSIAIVLCLVSAFIAAPRLEAFILIPSLLILLIPSLEALATRENYRSLHGIFLIAPYGIIFPYALRYAWQNNRHQLLPLALLALCYIAISVPVILITKVNHLGVLAAGLEWGSRYALPFYPIQAILALIALKIYLKSNRPLLLKQVVTGIIALMMMMGIQFQLRGIWMLYNDKQDIMKWQNILQAQRQEPIVTDLWWFPASVAPYFTAHEMYVLHSENANDWLALAQVHKIENFIYVSQTPWDAKLGPSAIPLVEAGRQTHGGMYFTHMYLASEDSAK